MYVLLFRSRWFALAWVIFMACYAVFLTSGSSVMGSILGMERAAIAKPKRDPEEERREKFRQWAAEGEVSRSGPADASEYRWNPNGVSGNTSGVGSGDNDDSQ